MQSQISLHRCHIDDDWQPLVLAIDGDLFLIGEDDEARQMHELLGAYLETGAIDEEVIGEFDPSWHYMRGMHWAIQCVRETAPEYAANKTDPQIGNSLRAAARRGTIRAASQDDAGNWYFRIPACARSAVRRGVFYWRQCFACAAPVPGGAFVYDR